jgi:hypothetical protein
MPAVTAKIKREALFQEIVFVLRQWPELERRVFSLTHYHGQSLEAISRSLNLDAEEVSAILKQCDRQLNACLRKFRKGSCGKAPPISAETACPAACSRDLKDVHALPSKVFASGFAPQIPPRSPRSQSG